MKKSSKITISLLFTFAIAATTTAQTNLLTAGSDWKYLDNGSNQGTGWRATSFNDANWKTGYGKFGYGITDAKTIISYGTNAKRKYITTYFRKSITIADTSAYTSYTAKVKRDDGVVVYVNGSEVYRNNLPTSSISYTTLATSATDNGTIAQSFSISNKTIRSGTNIIAVEIHQDKASTSDMAFDMELIGIAAPPPPTDQTPPSVTSINRQNPTKDTTSVTEVTFRVTFSEAVSGVDLTV